MQQNAVCPIGSRKKPLGARSPWCRGSKAPGFDEGSQRKQKKKQVSALQHLQLRYSTHPSGAPSNANQAAVYGPKISCFIHSASYSTRRLTGCTISDSSPALHAECSMQVCGPGVCGPGHALDRTVWGPSRTVCNSAVHGIQSGCPLSVALLTVAGPLFLQRILSGRCGWLL